MAGRFCMTLVAILCVACCDFLCSSFARDDEANNKNKIQALLAERRDTLRLHVEAVDAMYQSGRVDIQRVIVANDDLLDAELELRTAKPDRLEACKNRLDNLRVLERVVSEKHALGVESGANKLLVTAARMRAEIVWLRQQEPSN